MCHAAQEQVPRCPCEQRGCHCQLGSGRCRQPLCGQLVPMSAAVGQCALVPPRATACMHGTNLCHTGLLSGGPDFGVRGVPRKEKARHAHSTSTNKKHGLRPACSRPYDRARARAAEGLPPQTGLSHGGRGDTPKFPLCRDKSFITQRLTEAGGLTASSVCGIPATNPRPRDTSPARAVHDCRVLC